jgi:hypothetical protein
VMGTAKGNRLRPEEHTTGGPVVRQANRTGQPMAAEGRSSFAALEAEARRRA